MSSHIGDPQGIISEALLLQSTGCWTSLRRLPQKLNETTNPQVRLLLAALSASPLEPSPNDQRNLWALAEAAPQAAQNIALANLLLAHAQELILRDELPRATDHIRQALACSQSAVATCDILIPQQIQERHLNEATSLCRALVLQLELQRARIKHTLPCQLVLTLGMHRSGTSALTGCLAEAGLDAPNDLMPPTPANPKGYWESMSIYHLNENIIESLGAEWSTTWTLPVNILSERFDTAKRWVDDLCSTLNTIFPPNARAILKDPRLCVLLPILQPWLESPFLPITAILPIRHPDEVAGSLHTAESLPFRQGYLLWLDHVLKAERYSRASQRLFIDHARMITEPDLVLKECNDALTEALKKPDGGQSEASPLNTLASSFIEPSLYRRRTSDLSERAAHQEETDGWRDFAVTVYELLMTTRDVGAVFPVDELDGLWRHWITTKP